MKTTSNPSEWEVVKSVNWKNSYAIDQPDPRKSYIADDIDEGDAHFIVAAIQQRDELVAALKKALANPHYLSECALSYSIALTYPVSPALQEKADFYKGIISVLEKCEGGSHE